MSVSSTTPPRITRRSATKLLGGALLSSVAGSPLAWTQQATAPPATFSRLLTEDDLAFLADMEHAAFLFFCGQADPATGQMSERATNKNPTGEFDRHFASSVAATG